MVEDDDIDILVFVLLKGKQRRKNLTDMATLLTRSYYHSPCRATPFLGRSLGQQFYVTADKYPDKEMYVFYADKERKTFQQVRVESQQLAASFLSLGLNTGDRLGVWGGNHYEWLVTYVACMQLGIILIHIRLDFTGTMQTKLLQKTGCKALVLTRSPDNVYDSVCEIIPELRSCKADKLKCESLPELLFVAIGGEQHRGKRGVYNLDDLIHQGRSSAYKDKVTKICDRIDFDAPAAINFTSGSTGTPKAVTHSSHSILDFVHENGNIYRGNVQGYVQTWETKYALIMHMSGISGQVGAVIPIANGNTVVVVGPNYDKDLMAMAFHEEKVTNSVMLIHHMYDLLHLPYLDSLDFSHNQLSKYPRTQIVSGGTIIPPSLREKSKKICNMSLMVYGLTEMIGVLLHHPMDDPKRIQSGDYLCIGGCEAKIVNEKGEIVPVNTAGEIHFRGYGIFLYYWGDEEKTKQAKDDNGWLHTGDIAIMDEEGYIRIVGRKTDSMIIEGINVFPFDLEDVLLEHPSIAGVMVSSFLTPRYVLFMETFPTTDTGKFHRKKMAEIALNKLKLTSSSLQR
ncbi:medium-chain acyl-CoA ligase ACSF2, mitochondrial-like [Amphiura filiformis]|uniref:medium-chain acyl-CoA ligase ACSF2, mitochondrial-like n=1 Tax=Amphiura filiformis TaxID=82378 RepID=UPI003B20EBEA